MAVSKKAKNIYSSIFDGTETFAANVIINVQEKKNLKKYISEEPVPSDYAKEYKAFWGKYGNFSPKWGWYYVTKNEIRDVRYVPHNIIYTKIDQHFNSRKLGWGFNDKNYYSKIFNGIKQPETVAHIFGSGIFTDENYKQISKDEVLKKVLENEEVICKPARESGSGRDIVFWKPEKDQEDIKNFLQNKTADDYVIQKVLKQHPELNKVHQNSINTVRICSLLLEDGVHILSSCLRMGVDDNRVDNVTAGGISCGIRDGGVLDEYAYDYFTGARTAEHPQGYVFKGNKVPSFDKAVDLVKQMHPMIAHFRLVSWDIAIDEVGDPVLIEANMRKGGINLHQFSNGPLFGDLTERVMDEVFGK